MRRAVTAAAPEQSQEKCAAVFRSELPNNNWIERFRGSRKRGIALALLATFCAFAAPVAAEPVEIRSSQIRHFRLGSSETNFGALEFIGGLVLRSTDPAFGQLSAIRFLSPGSDFIGVADHGFWYFGTIARDAGGVPVGIENFRMEAMLGKDAEPLPEKGMADAEGLDVSGDVATVSFEREARISEYRLGPQGAGTPLQDIDIVIPRHELRYNAGIETVMRLLPSGIQEGARVAIAERSIDVGGNIFAAILEGPQKGVFKVKRTDSFDVTDGAVLPGGDLLLLERRFSGILGVGVRLRRIASDTVRKGALVDGPTLMQADLGYHIDNLEGLDVWQRADGATIVSLISDDNQSFLQRTLYLEFRLTED